MVSGKNDVIVQATDDTKFCIDTSECHHLLIISVTKHVYFSESAAGTYVNLLNTGVKFTPRNHIALTSNVSM